MTAQVCVLWENIENLKNPRTKAFYANVIKRYKYGYDPTLFNNTL